MKYYPEKSGNKLPNSINALIEKLRLEKNFIAQNYVLAKTRLINQYFKENNLDTAIVALSGGIDSAVVYKILHKAKEDINSPIKNIVSLTLPALNCLGVTNQEESRLTANLLKCDTINIEPLAKLLEKTINQFTNGNLSPWAQGQSIPYLRTSFLYSLTAALSDNGKKSIIVGTTNKDEGSYLGYIGKASDGLTDLQIISDLHKSEVYSVAKFLDVPMEIINKIPTGDMYDNRSDEEVFGAPYDFVELYTNLLHKEQTEYLSLETNIEYQSLNEEDKIIFKKYSKNIESLHNYNRHKYISCSSAIHLDIKPFYFKGSWRNNTTWDRETIETIFESKYVNLVTINPTFNKIKTPEVEKLAHNIYKLETLLEMNEVNSILSEIENTKEAWQRANKYGKIEENAKVGSFRKSWYSKDFSKTIKQRINNLPLGIYTPTTEIQDDEGLSICWSLDSVGSLFRFIKYKDGDSLVPHYDESFKVSSTRRTLYSLVIYLTNGETQFFNENRVNHSYKDFELLSSETNLTKYLTAKCKPGDALIFQHRLLHDSPIINNEKIIIRSDLIFEKPNLGGALKGY